MAVCKQADLIVFNQRTIGLAGCCQQIWQVILIKVKSLGKRHVLQFRFPIWSQLKRVIIFSSETC